MRQTIFAAVMLAFARILFAGAADFDVRTFTRSTGAAELTAALDSAQTYAKELAVAREFQSRYPNDMQVQIRTASILAVDNADSTRAFYRRRLEQNPDDLTAMYFVGRLSQTPDEQRQYADKILAKDSNNYWGKLLLANSYTPETDPGMKQAEAALRQAIAADNSLPYAVERLGQLLRTRGDKEDADAVFVKLCRMQPGSFEPWQYRLMLVAYNYQKQIALADEFLDKHPDNVDALYAKARAQREIPDWPAHVRTMTRIVELSRTGPHAYDLACGFSLSGQKDSAFAYLFTAIDLGFADVEQYKNDEDLIPLHSDPRWSEILVRAEAAEREKLAEIMKQAAANAVQRKEEAVASRGNAPAPDWEVRSLDGKTVKLSDLRGKVVVLDFWATWCGPCKKSMPLVDQFYQSRPEGVEVFGMNVWERGGTDKVKPFIEERGYRFPILLGTNEIAEAYGVRGIPTLVMIDKEGKIAYKHVGYDPLMAQTLAWQAKELLK